MAAMICELTGRSLYVDWRDTAYGDGSSNYFPSLFEVRDLSTLSELPKEGTTFPPAWSGRLQLSLDEVVAQDSFEWSRAAGMATYSFDQRLLEHPAAHLVMWEMDHFKTVRGKYEIRHPEIRGLDDEELASLVLHKHFRVCDQVQEAVRSFGAVHFADSRSFIGIHVRLTEESERNRRNPDLTEFIDAARRLVKKTPAARIFLSTDNTDVIERFIAEFGSSKILVREKWMPGAGQPLHANQLCPDKLKNAVDALVDAFLLGKCEWLVTSISSSFKHSVLNNAA